MHAPPFKLEAFFEEFEFEPNMNALGSSDAQTLMVGELLKLSDKPLDISNIPLSYQDVKGDESLRAAVAEMYRSSKIFAENVLITTGASEAIFLSLYALLEPHDAALVCRPVFQSVYEVSRMIGATVNFYDYVPHDFTPDLSAVHRALDGPSVPRLLFINTPHNPTGRTVNESELKNLLFKAQRVGVAVVVNEMYSGVWLPPTQPIPSALTLNSDAIVISGLSKVFGLGGLRIGWVVGPTEFINKCKEWRYYTTLAPPAIIQRLAEIAVRNSEAILDRTRAIVYQNYQTAMQWLHDHDTLFSWVPPDAGQVMLIRLKLDIDTEKFARRLAREASVLLIPCTTCFELPQGYLRLGLGGEPSKFTKGLEQLGSFLRTYH